MRLSGKVAVVTGAGGGIGEATIVRFAQEGARVACVDVKPDGAERAAALAEKEGASALALAYDVSTADGNREIVEETVRAFGGLDILHANAAVQVMGDWRRRTPRTGIASTRPTCGESFSALRRHFRALGSAGVVPSS